MKVLEGTEYDMKWKVRIYRDTLAAAHEVKDFSATNHKHVQLLHDN